MDYGENPISPLTISLPMDGLTNLPSPQDTSPIDYQLAGQDTETALVVCYYLDATPKLFRYLLSGEVTKMDIKIHMNWHLLSADLLGLHSRS